MNYILDLIIIALLLISIFLCAKKGFVKTVTGFIGLLLSIYFAITLSLPAANFAYEKIVEPACEKSIISAIGGNNDDLNSGVWDSLPSFVRNSAEKYGLSKENIISSAEEKTETLAHKITETAVKPVTVPLLKSVISLVLFIVLYIASKFLSKVLNKIFSFSIIGTANKFLGGVIGLAKGSIYGVLFVLITVFIVSLTGGFLCFTDSAIQTSKVFKFILGILPINY